MSDANRGVQHRYSILYSSLHENLTFLHACLRGGYCSAGYCTVISASPLSLFVLAALDYRHHLSLPPLSPFAVPFGLNPFFALPDVGFRSIELPLHDGIANDFKDRAGWYVEQRLKLFSLGNAQSAHDVPGSLTFSSGDCSIAAGSPRASMSCTKRVYRVTIRRQSSFHSPFHVGKIAMTVAQTMLLRQGRTAGWRSVKPIADLEVSNGSIKAEDANRFPTASRISLASFRQLRNQCDLP